MPPTRSQGRAYIKERWLLKVMFGMWLASFLIPSRAHHNSYLSVGWCWAEASSSPLLMVTAMAGSGSMATLFLF